MYLSCIARHVHVISSIVRDAWGTEASWLVWCRAKGVPKSPAQSPMSLSQGMWAASLCTVLAPCVLC